MSKIFQDPLMLTQDCVIQEYGSGHRHSLCPLESVEVGGMGAGLNF